MWEQMKIGGIREDKQGVRNGGGGWGHTTGGAQEAGGVGETGRSFTEAENQEHLQAHREELGTVGSLG